MTPFDPVAIVVMLLTFYPLVTPNELARARHERPEYFAGGTLIGSKGDKLALGDGRVFDMIQNAGGLLKDRRWQALDVTNDPGAADDPYALTPGPLTLLDEMELLESPLETFTGIVGQFVSDTRGVDGALERIARPAIDALGADPDAALAAHEAVIIASQRADRATLGALYVTDELGGGDAVDGRGNDALRDVVDVQAAHAALSPRIDEHAAEIPNENTPTPNEIPDDPRDWKTPHTA